MFNESKITIVLLLVFSVLLFLNLGNSKSIREYSNDNIEIKNNSINLSSMTLRQKIGQMVIATSIRENKEELQEMGIGGIYLGAEESPSAFKEKILFFQEGSKIPFHVSADMEGCGNPFENFKSFPALKDIANKTHAFDVGREEGELMKEIGFTINFSPVVDLEDSIWNCRSFQGNSSEISVKAGAYIDGLQSEGILATSKHYPGKTLCIRDPHLEVVSANISREDLLPFEESIKHEVGAIMVSHVITEGLVDSRGKPADASPEVIESLEGHNGLLVSDEIRMLGLKNFYEDDDAMFVELVNSGNDIILYFAVEPKELEHFIDVIEKAVGESVISEGRIDRSVKKILVSKGFVVET